MKPGPGCNPLSPEHVSGGNFIMNHLFLVLLLALTATISKAQTLSASEKKSIFQNAKKGLTEQYHFRDKVAPTLKHLDSQWASGKYDTMNTIASFSEALSGDIKEVTKDGHMNFFYRSAVETGSGDGPAIPWGLLNDNFLNNGLNGVEIISGDIGLIRLKAFGSIEDLLPAAFTFVRNTGALIIDLRDNGGGMLSNTVSSYLFEDTALHLNTILWNDRTDSIYTHPVPGPKYLDKPVYLLVNKGTFSSAEEFAYDLQAMKRAVVVGEQTGGGANPGGTMPVYEFADKSRLDMYVSLGHVVNPVTGSNWERTGVTPDIAVTSDLALYKAQELALTGLVAKEKNPDMNKQYQEILKKIREKSASLTAK